MSWTNERIELLQKLWLEGCSASRIAGELGAGITRNAVIGKVYRLGLSGRVKAAVGHVPASSHQKAPRRAAHPRPSAPATIGNTALALQPLVMEAPLPQAAVDVVVPICEPVTIMELREIDVPLADRRSNAVRISLLRREEIAGPRALLRLPFWHRLSRPE